MQIRGEPADAVQSSVNPVTGPVKSPRGSSFAKPRARSVCLRPALHDQVDPTRAHRSPELAEHRLAGGARALCHNLDATVVEVACPADQPGFKRSRADPPAHSHPLDATVQPGGQPDISVWRGHGGAHQRPFRGRGWHFGHR
jgi:hypothetical protein